MPWYLGVLLTVFLPLVLINIYTGWKLTSAISVQFGFRKKRTALVLTLGLLFLNSLPIAAFFANLLWGRPAMTAFSGENRLIDMVLVYPFWTALVITVQLSLLFLCWDLIRLIALKVFRASSDWWATANRKTTLVMVMLVTLYSIPTLYVQTNIPRVNEQTVLVPDEFSGLDGLRILHISDVQGDGRTDKHVVRDFVSLANGLDADIVMNSGDYVTTGDAYITGTTDELAGLTSKMGKYAVIGDHDLFTGFKQEVMSAVRTADHIMLEDTSIIIPYRDTYFGLTFVTYTYRQRPSTGQLDTILALPDSVYRMVLVHQPAMQLVSLAAQKGYDLVLAGHTHGGGIAFGVPGLGFLAPASFETRYVSGLYEVGKTFVHVTNGLGFTLAPVRFNAPIELSLLTLRTVTR